MTPLRQKMIQDMKIRGLSEKTQYAYVRYVSRFAAHFRRSPDRLGSQHVHAFQMHLLDNGVSYSTLKQLVLAVLVLAEAAGEDHKGSRQIRPPSVRVRPGASAFGDLIQQQEQHRMFVLQRVGLRLQLRSVLHGFAKVPIGFFMGEMGLKVGSQLPQQTGHSS